MKNNKKAFTLAEVLITLTIIGVIAALTIPNLMQSYKKHQVEVGVKEAYSLISNAIKMSEAENGPASEWNYNLDQSTFPKTYIYPYLKVAKMCEGSKNFSQCLPQENGTYFFKTLKNVFPTNSEYYSYPFSLIAILKNGNFNLFDLIYDEKKSFRHLSCHYRSLFDDGLRRKRTRT